MIETVQAAIAPHDVVALALLFPVGLFGVLLALFDPGLRLDKWLEQRAGARQGFDVVIPAPALGAIALAGLVALSVLGCYGPS